MNPRINSADVLGPNFRSHSFPAFAPAEGAAAPVAVPVAAPDLGTLPEWNLADLYPGRDSPEIAADLARSDRAAAEFAERLRGRLAELSGDEMAKAVSEYETLQACLDRLMSFAYLVYAANVADAENGRFFQTIQEKVTDISTKLLFFTLELNRIEDGAFEQKLRDKALARYAPWLRNLRVYRPHQLSDDLEKLLHEKHVAGRAAWTRLFDETMAGLRFSVDGRELTVAEVLHLLSDRDGGKRKAAAKALGQVLGQNVRLFSLITNTLAKDKEIEDRWRGYAKPASARHLSNLVEDAVVEALRAAVHEAYPRLSHRYYRLKAEWLGGERLDYWDRGAPLPDEDDRDIPWNEARDTVLSAYRSFSPEMAAIGQRFFDRGWIDAPARPGKESGAFSHPTVPGVHPYILMNYQGKPRDVATLAHELGHGVHQVLASPQGLLLADTPLTLAETASVFGEMLTFRWMLDRQTDPRRRRAMLAQKVEDMLNTVVRQIAFYEFELRVHDERRKGELPAERLGEIWLDVQRESLGPALRFDDDYRVFWTYIPHFVHSPFYVYAYAFGDCLVNALYGTYQAAPSGFVEKYLAMLRAGGTLRHRELLAPFGLDASDPKFWGRGLDVVGGFIDELEKLV